MKAKQPRPSALRQTKIVDLLDRIKLAVEAGNYCISNHAYERSQDRLIPMPHVEQVLLHGFHEKRKDTFSEEFKSWNYSIRGKSPDFDDVRVVVSFTRENLLVVTVINLNI